MRQIRHRVFHGWWIALVCAFGLLLVGRRIEFFSMDSAVDIAVLRGKRFRGCRVCVDVAHELASQIFYRSEDSASDHVPFNAGKPEFDLI